MGFVKVTMRLSSWKHIPISNNMCQASVDSSLIKRRYETYTDVTVLEVATSSVFTEYLKLIPVSIWLIFLMKPYKRFGRREQ